MKSIPKLLKFLKGRWMRRLVWLPCSLIAVLFLGATLQSKGFKLSLLPPVRSQTRQVHPSSNGQLPATPTIASFPGTSRKVDVDRLPRVNPTSTNVVAQAQASTSSSIAIRGYSNTIPASYSQVEIASQPSVVPIAIPLAQGGVTANLLYSPRNAPVFSQNIAIPRPNMDQANQMAALINKIHGLQGGDTTAMRDCLGELLEMTIRQFDEKQDRERASLQQTRDTLTIWEEAIEQRENLKKPLIESYIAQLLQTSDPLNWSFSGAELLKNKPNHANYQEILKQLWFARTNQEGDPPLPLPRLPEITAEKNPTELPSLSAF